MRMQGKSFIAVGIAICCPLMGAAQSSDVPPPIPREFRAAWVATVANIDWPTSRYLSSPQQQAEAIQILEVARQLKLNALFVQFRPACDALYASSQEPWSEYLTGLMGRAPYPYYDPLEFWIDEGHKRGIEIHAWLNPYRARHSTGSSPIAPNHVSVTHPHIVRTYDVYKWLDPGEPDTPDYTLAAVADIVGRYDVDGIVFDDYFYPYPVSGVPFPDGTSYQAYQNNGGTLSLGDWRRDNVNRFVQRCYAAIRALKSDVKFGIAPFGIWRPNNPPGVQGLDAYASIYADSKKWLQNGWIDYFSPQLYWKISAPNQSYPALLSWWVAQNTQGRHIWPSNFASKVDGTSSSWPAQEILDQIQITRDTPGATGNVHYSIKPFKYDRLGIRTTLAAGMYAYPTLPPATPWLDATPPPAPVVRFTEESANIVFHIAPNRGEQPTRFAIYTRYGDAWQHEVISSQVREFQRPKTSGGLALHTVLVSSVDRSGNEGPKARAAFRGGWDG